VKSFACGGYWTDPGRYGQARASQRPSTSGRQALGGWRRRPGELRAREHHSTPRTHRESGHSGPDSMQRGAECHSGLRVLVNFGSAASGQAGVLIDRAAAYDRDGEAMRPVGGRRDEGKSEQVVATDRFKGDPQMAQRRNPSGRAAHHVRHRAHHGSYSRYRPPVPSVGVLMAGDRRSSGRSIPGSLATAEKVAQHVRPVPRRAGSRRPPQ
jgi:hypothetical protein